MKHGDAKSLTRSVLQLLMPLLSQVRRNDDQDAPTALRPTLRDDKACLNRFTQTNLVSEEDASREWIPTGEQCRLYLVRVEVHLGVNER